MVKIALARAGSAGQTEDAEQAENTSSAAAGSGPSSPSEDTVDADPVVAVLIPAARAAAAALHSQRRRVTRKALADVLRADGYGVSNARASALLRELKPELDGRMSPSGLPGVSVSSRSSGGA